MALLTLIVFTLPSMYAQRGAPHTFTVTPNYENVTLHWEKPTTPEYLRWNDGKYYDGSQGELSDEEGMCTLYAGALFTPQDIIDKGCEGKVIESVSYFEYRPVYSVTAMIYEDGKVVREEKADLSNFKTNTIRPIPLKDPYTIAPGKEIMVILKIVHGRNLDFVGIRDNTPTEKGGYYSYDGKKWMKAPTSFLVTANIKNTATELPAKYVIYRDGAAVKEVSDTTDVLLENEPEGEHEYNVSAQYDNDAAFSTIKVKVTVKKASSYFPSVSTLKTSVEELTGTINWTAPLVRTGNKLTWSAGVYGNAIGGTASSNTKVWVRNEFAPSDLLSFANYRITSISTSFKEATVNGIKLFVMKNGVINYVEEVLADSIAKIEAGKMMTFPLTIPYVIEAGNTYSYGMYVLHTPNTKPISVDNSKGIEGKGNVFSTSSPNSTAFVNSKPTWKTLGQGNIAGNWLMTATIEPIVEEAPVDNTVGYNVYRNGEKIASNITETSYDESVTDLGTYKYGVEAIGESGRTSSITTASITYTLPSGYNAPILDTPTIDKEKGEISFNWNMLSELRHWGKETYVCGFDEDMSLIYGSKFTATELAKFKDFYIEKLRFAIGANVGAFKLQIYKGDGTLLVSEDIPDGAVEPLTIYSLNLETPLKITGDDDLYIVYNANLPAASTPMIVDAGPAVENGAVVSLTNGASWMKLGTINSTYSGYNIVISALVNMNVAAPKSKSLPKRECEVSDTPLQKIMIDLGDEGIEYGVEAEKQIQKAEKQIQKAPSAQALSFNVYRNEELVKNLTAREFSDKLDKYGLYNYYVTAVFHDNWESAPSEPINLAYTIPQLSVAPYKLEGVADGNNVKLTWKAPEESPELSYQVGSLSYGVGMTGTGTRTTYAVAKFPVDSLIANVGKEISHIDFGLYSKEIMTAAVVVFDNFNIAYEQPISVDTLKIYSEGMNSVRLDKPFEILPGHELMIGYHITYANGIKPMLCDEGPADDKLGNLLSASASYTSWKSLKSMSSALNYNWRVSAKLKEKDVVAKAPMMKAEGDITYNVYANNALVASNVATPNYTVNSATSGTYYVTAMKDDKESSRSNIIYVEVNSSVNDINTDASMYYDATSMKVIFGEKNSAKVYAISGTLVKDVVDVTSLDMSEMAPGAYIVVANNKTLRIIK